MTFLGNIWNKIQNYADNTLKKNKEEEVHPASTLLTEMISVNDYDHFVEFVERENIDLSITTWTGKNLLQVCITWTLGQNLDIIDYILYNCPKLVTLINQKDRHGQNAIFNACYMGRYDVAQKLMAFGADYKTENENMLGISGPHACMMRRKYWALHKLIEAGVDTLWLRRLAHEILQKHQKIDISFLDDIIEDILHYHEVTVPRIRNFFYLINSQINYVDFKKKSNENKMQDITPVLMEHKSKHEEITCCLRYKTLLGRIPKYA